MKPFGFTGQQQDGNGLVYLRARYYDPATGRFLSRDSYAGEGTDPLSLNRYTYAENNPGLNTDPSGQCPVCVIVAPVVVPVVIEGEQLIGEYGPGAVDTFRDGMQWVQQHAGQHPATSTPVRSPGPSATATPGPSGPYVLPAAARRASRRLPPTAGPNVTLYRVDPISGALTFYEVYYSNGLPIKRVGLVGPAHGGMPTSHVQEYVQNVAPDGTVYVNTGSVRPARPDEIP